ncbi:MAG: homoserine O-succinyltransferase [Prevotella sp.]|nr:homoserine O-succinyltransferase [Prevotella sp.]
MIVNGNGHDAARVGVLNLMPLKEVTERDFIRLFSAIEEPVELVWLRLRSHVSRHTSQAHMDELYTYFDEATARGLDGIVITGAPVESLSFEEVTYWPELCAIFDYCRARVHNIIYICWAAQAGLYYHYDIPKYPLPKKMFGIYSQRLLSPDMPLFKDFGDEFSMPHSRHTEVRKTDILACKGLQIAAESAECGVSVVTARRGREVYITGHMEYAADTLDAEYRRDKDKRADVGLPEHYYLDDIPGRMADACWQPYAVLLYRNWVRSLLSDKD